MCLTSRRYSHCIALCSEQLGNKMRRETGPMQKTKKICTTQNPSAGLRVYE